MFQLVSENESCKVEHDVATNCTRTTSKVDGTVTDFYDYGERTCALIQFADWDEVTVVIGIRSDYVSSFNLDDLQRRAMDEFFAQTGVRGRDIQSWGFSDGFFRATFTL